MQYRRHMKGIAIRSWIHSLRAWARRIKRDVLTLWLALRHPQTPWLAKALAFVVVAYALSPIDLIPDFIPVLGFVDDALLLPGLIWLALRQVPTAVLTACREQAEHRLRAGQQDPRSAVGAALVIVVWAAALCLAWYAWGSRH